MRNPNPEKRRKPGEDMAMNGPPSLDITHVQCDVENEIKGKKIKRLMRADSDLSETSRTVPPRPFLKELKRQNSVGDVLSVILNKSRAQINSLFSKKLMTTERRQSQNHGKNLESLIDLSVLRQKEGVMDKSVDSIKNVSPLKHCDKFSSILNEPGQESKGKVPNMKPSLSPTLSDIQAGRFKPQFRFSTETSPSNGPWKVSTKEQYNNEIRPPSITSATPANYYQLSGSPSIKPTDSKNQMVRILSYLYLGGIESAYNESALCKANVDALVDIANVPPNFSVPGRKLECPCFCMDKLHFRSKLYIAVDDIEWESMEQYFEEINNFVEGARKCHKSVLIYSYHGKSRSAAAVIQYLMNHFRISLDLAYRTVKCRKPDIVINQGLWKALERLDKKIVDSEKRVLKSCQISKSAPPTVRDAWLEC